MPTPRRIIKLLSKCRVHERITRLQKELSRKNRAIRIFPKVIGKPQVSWAYSKKDTARGK